METLITNLSEHLSAGHHLRDFSLCHEQLCDWSSYVNFGDETYHRQLVYQRQDHGQFEIFVISWRQGQKSKIHDHPHQGCLLKVLSGVLNERNYHRPEGSRLVACGEQLLPSGHVSYKVGNQCLHEIEAMTDSVSIHIYSPSNYQSTCYN